MVFPARPTVTRSATLDVRGFGMVQASCTLSRCGFFRYDLVRRWALGGPLATFILLNPSTADHTVNDPTARRGMGFARDWGLNGMVFLNLYAFRATSPEILRRQLDPIGPENDEMLRSWAIGARETNAPVVCAWGANAAGERADVVVRMLRELGVGLNYLRLTKDGVPEHPLYLPASLKPTPWAPMKES